MAGINNIESDILDNSTPPVILLPAGPIRGVIQGEHRVHTTTLLDDEVLGRLTQAIDPVEEIHHI